MLKLLPMQARVLARRKVGLGSGGLKGPFVDGESVDEGTWLEGKQGPWFLSVCPHLSPPSSLWDRGGGMGDAVTMGSCWAWGRPPGFRPVCRSFPLAEISTGSLEENVEPLGLGSSLLRQKHWLPLPILGFLSLGYTSALRLGSLRGGVTPSQWSPKGNVRLGAGAAHRELLGDLPAGGAVDSDTVLVRLEGWRLVRPPSPPVYPVRVLTPARLACLVHSMASTSSQLPIPAPCFSPPLYMPIVQMRRLRHTEAKKAGRDSSRAEWRQSWLWSQKTWVASMPVQHLTPCVVGVRFWGFTEQSHCRCNKKLNVAAHTTPRLRTILMLGSQPRGDSTGSWEEGLAKGD